MDATFYRPLKQGIIQDFLLYLQRKIIAIVSKIAKNALICFTVARLINLRVFIQGAIIINERKTLKYY